MSTPEATIRHVVPALRRGGYSVHMYYRIFLFNLVSKNQPRSGMSVLPFLNRSCSLRAIVIFIILK